MSIFAYAIQLLIAALFLHAGISKLSPQNQSYYQRVVQGYELFPSSFVKLIPFILGVFEILAALAILIKQTSSIGLIAATALLSLYGLVFARQLLKGKTDINCGCAGPGADVRISPLLLVRNATLVALCVFAIIVGSSTFVASWFLVVPIATVLGLIYLSSEQLMLNQQKIEILSKT